MFSGLEKAVQTAAETGMYANGGADFSKDPQVMDDYQVQREQCYATNKVIPMDQPEAAVAAEGIAAFFTPNEGQLGLQTLKTEIFKLLSQQTETDKGYLYIAIEHFSNTTIANALNKVANAGVDVRIIMNSGTVSGSSEVTSDGPFYNQYLKNDKIQVRFIETNPAAAGAAGAGQQMHNKFAILNGHRVFSGAGHYTTSGLDTNFETLYLTQNDVLTQKYQQYFKDLWEQSVDENYITQHTPLVPAPALNPKVTPAVQAPGFFGQLIQGFQLMKKKK